MIKKLHTFIRRQLSHDSMSSFEQKQGIAGSIFQKSFTKTKGYPGCQQPSLLQKLEPKIYV